MNLSSFSASVKVPSSCDQAGTSTQWRWQCPGNENIFGEQAFLAPKESEGREFQYFSIRLALLWNGATRLQLGLPQTTDVAVANARSLTHADIPQPFIGHI